VEFLRLSTRLLVLFLVFYLTFHYLPLAATVDWLCPFWHLQALAAKNFNQIFLGTSWRPFSFSAIWLLALLIFSALLLGRVFCGWVCPFGFLMEVLGKASHWLGGKKNPKAIFSASLSLPDFFRFGKYLFLLVFLLLAFVYGEAVFCFFCPAGGVLKAMVGVYMSLPLFLLAFLVVAVLFWGMKVWCGYLCPLGGFLSFFSRFQVFKIRKEGNCAGCQNCSKVCPMEVKLGQSFKGKELSSPDCLMCLRCLKACPEGILKFPWGD